MELNPSQTILCRKVHLLDKRYPWCSADLSIKRQNRKKKLLAELHVVNDSIKTVIGEQNPALVAEAALS